MPEYVMEGRDESARELDGFTHGYVEALFFTNTEPSTTREDHPRERVEQGEISELPGDYGFYDLAPETLDAIKADCAAFQKANAALLESAYGKPGYDEQAAGRDYWFTRCGHGVGYWDRGLDAIGDALTEAAKRAGNRDAYMGDDSRVYLF